MKDSFEITSDYLKHEILDLEEYVAKDMIPKYKNEIELLFNEEFKTKFDKVVLHYDGKNKSIAEKFPKYMEIDTELIFEETKTELDFHIGGKTELFEQILTKQNKGTAVGIIPKEELDFFLKDDTTIKRKERKSDDDKSLFMSDIYSEKNFFYEPTFNDIKFAERVEALFQKVVDNFIE